MQQAKIHQAIVTAVELKQLTVALLTKQNVCFRSRQIGEMWMKHHCQVSSVNDKTVLLYDEVEGKYQLIRFNSVMQFDIDNRFQQYHPHFHYDVCPSPELE